MCQEACRMAEITLWVYTCSMSIVKTEGQRRRLSQQKFTCSKSTKETREKGMKHVQR